ncbi:PRC-barrel domain protein [Lyngbya aestuarii BL J]|uniref:PRC-barrel domain protein n=1 Tax=Lyngbya aestuarii BL J TaxID=1348334 RepID=U7QEQ0_9CYAN|nr:PRC-barrel domain-containing protein [Lyngbya aestuarii]ERT05560.1 PRC-barrel domain protein [Lyngbya aestuarii BL J]
MTFETIRQRSELLGTQVITRDRGKRLGVVSQLWVDVDQREIVAIGLRDNFLAVAGLPKYMYLSSVREIGDVLLVDDERVLEEDIDVEAYSTLINSEVITETGEPLGRVRGFKFDPLNGKLISIIIASIGLPQIPDQIISTYELSVDEIVSSGPNRLIVFERAEEKLQQITVGVLERMGLGEAPWEKEEEGMYYPPTIKSENQLPKGISQTPPERQYQPNIPVVEEVWEDEQQWQEPAAPQPLRQPQTVYDDYEEDNWSDVEGDEYDERYSEPEYVPLEPYEEKRYSAREYEYEDDVESDAWADDETPKPYQPPRVNIPEKKKMPEYEEEPGGY